MILAFILLFLIDCECSDAICSNAFKGTKLIPMLRAPIGMPPLDDVARTDVALYQPLEEKDDRSHNLFQRLSYNSQP